MGFLNKNTVPQVCRHVMIAFIAVSTFVSASAFAEDAAFTLVGTIVSRSMTGAVIKNAQGEQTLYLLHERLPDGSEIIDVAKSSIRLRGRDNAVFDLYILHGLNPAAASAPNAGAPSIAEKPLPPVPQAAQPSKRRQRSARSYESSDE
jgi:hypothetical protein